jgi:electron transport complex protein RnfG
MKNKIMPTLVLTAICLVVAFALALINEVTAPIIADAQDRATKAALTEVLPEGKNFEEITIDAKYPTAITKGYSADGGYVFQATVTGKSSGLVIMIGINADGKIVNSKVIADQETDDYDVKVFPVVSGVDGSYKGMDLEGFEPVLISGATLTSKAYSKAIQAALQAFVIADNDSVNRNITNSEEGGEQ